MNAKHELTKTIFAPFHIYLEEIFKAAEENDGEI